MMTVFRFCLYLCLSSETYFGLGIGCLEIYLRYRSGKHIDGKNKHHTVLYKIILLFKQQSHQIFVYLFCFAQL